MEADCQDLVEAADSVLDFDAFMELLSVVRRRHVALHRQRAGFEPADMVAFQELFEVMDADKSGYLEATESPAMFEQLGLSVGTTEERAEALKDLAQAAANAKEAGVVDTGSEG